MRRESRPKSSKFKNYPFVLRSLEGAKRGETRFTQTGTANKTPCLGVTLWEETTSGMQSIAPIQNPERIRASSIIPHESSVLKIGRRGQQTRDKEIPDRQTRDKEIQERSTLETLRVLLV